MLFLVLFLPLNLFAASEEANVYFNAATEKYLQGNFTEATESLDKAQALDPENKKIKDFTVKILLEAATQNQLNRNYKQAFEYLKKAIALAPEDPKVKEMYLLTQELINPGKEKTLPKEKSQLLPSVIEEDKNPSASAKQEKKQQPKPAVQAKPAPVITNTYYIPSKETKTSPLPTALIVTSIILLLAFLALLTAFISISNAKQTLEEKYAVLNDSLGKMNVELEKLKERYKFEHESAERLRLEIKDTKKRDEDRFKMEIDLKAKQIEERVRSEYLHKKASGTGQQEAFVHQQQAKFLEFVGDTSRQDPEDTSSPAVQAIRERIASMAQNLYESSPGAAVDFINKMLKNDNPLIRSNIVLSLVRISKPETTDMLIELFSDPDPRVKREVIKSLKQIKQKNDMGHNELNDLQRNKIVTLLQDEKNKGEWIF